MAIDIKKAKKLNIASSNNFAFEIGEIPYVSMFAQRFEVPGCSFGRVTRATPFVDLSEPGEKMEFEDLSVAFLVDEDFLNYREVWKWMSHLGFPEGYDQFRQLKDGETQYKYKSDISVHILTNKFNPTHIITFVDCFPINLSGVEFTNNDSEIIHPEATVTFDYSYYYFNGDRTTQNLFDN